MKFEPVKIIDSFNDSDTFYQLYGCTVWRTRMAQDIDDGMMYHSMPIAKPVVGQRICYKLGAESRNRRVVILKAVIIRY